jgi:hypothetical protein
MEGELDFVSFISVNVFKRKIQYMYVWEEKRLPRHSSSLLLEGEVYYLGVIKGSFDTPTCRARPMKERWCFGREKRELFLVKSESR